jgi:hypothetical protein
MALPVFGLPALASFRLTKTAFHAIFRGMNGQEILARLRENETALRARGVSHAALFGSRARGDNRPDSDTDVLVGILIRRHTSPSSTALKSLRP